MHEFALNGFWPQAMDLWQLISSELNAANVINLCLFIATAYMAYDTRRIKIENHEIANRERLFMIYFEYNRRFAEIMMKFSGDILSATAPEDTNELKKNMIIYFNLCQEEFYLNNKGLIDKNLWTIWEQGIRNYMSRTAFRIFWIQLRDNPCYMNDFRESMNRILSETGPR